MSGTPDIKKDTTTLELGKLELASDYRQIHADSFFVGLASTNDAEQKLVISVFENQLIPLTEEDGDIGVRFSQRAVATFVTNAHAARLLHSALSAAIADLGPPDISKIALPPLPEIPPRG